MTNEEFQNLLIDYINSLQLPGALGVLSRELKRIPAAEANHVAQIAMAGATASQSDTARLIKLLRGVVTYLNQIDNDITNIETDITGGQVYLGVTTGFTLGGTPPEFDTVTETGKTWVTASTVVVPFTPVPITSAYEFYAVKVDNYSAGNGFDVTLYNPQNTAAGNGPDVTWIGFPNGING